MPVSSIARRLAIIPLLGAAPVAAGLFCPVLQAVAATSRLGDLTPFRTNRRGHGRVGGQG